jgi:competence ComEA-like helix-hairpin-helix protein
MQASMQTRGARVATAGSVVRPVAGASAPASHGALLALWRFAAGSTWLKPACKFLALLALLTALSWIGSRQTAFGWHLATRDTGNTMLSSMTGASALALPGPRVEAGLADAGTEAASEAAVKVASGVLPDGRVVLNIASEEELCKLPRVGQKRAAAIVALRQRMGRLRSVRDLLRVKGLGLRTLQKIQPLVVLDPPTDAGIGD